MQIEQTPLHDHLVRGLTHRMNNILSLFHGYVGMMLDNQTLDKSTRDGLKKIKDGACAASELMDRTHALMRPSAVVWREVDLGDFIPLLKPSMDAFRSPLASLEIDIADDLPKVRTDLARLKTAMFELVRNACDATEDGGDVRIEVRTEAPIGNLSAAGTSAAQPSRWVSIAVVDNGPGIDPEIQSRIFHPFFSTKRRQTATGLGLNVAMGCVEQIGGVLRSTSEPGKTRFVILLPASL